MPRPTETPFALAKSDARRIWLRAQRLDRSAPFGDGPEATRAAVEHLGYVQIDTINVIERCHHHILYARIPGYRREHLHQAQTIDKSVFEYWTHALSYLPTRDLRFYVGAMKRHWQRRSVWFAAVKPADLRKVLGRIRTQGALTIRDIDDDVLVEKDHAWASRKPSKRALQLAFYRGFLTVSAARGHAQDLRADRPGTSAGSGCRRPPRRREILNYLLDRALRSQGVVSLEFGLLSRCPAQAGDAATDRDAGAPQGAGGGRARGRRQAAAWAAPETLEATDPGTEDPCTSCRRSTRWSISASGCSFSSTTSTASRPTSRRRNGGSATSPCPVLVGDEIVAAARSQDRPRRGRSCWCSNGPGLGKRSRRLHKRRIEEALHRFERFQLAR